MSEELQEVVDRRTLWVGYEIGSNEQAKNIIRNNINRMCDSWISTGFVLKQARDKEFYKQDGYSCIQDYAFGEFGIKKQRASKLIKIIEDLSVNGNSPVLEDRWKEFSIAKLEEIIYLEEDDRESVQPVMTKVQIRNIGKNDNAEVSPAKLEPEPGKIIPAQVESEPATPVQARPHSMNIDFTKSIDTLAAEFEASAAYDCPPGQSDCRRTDWGPDGTYNRKKNGPSKDCLRCWKNWLTVEKISRGADQEEIQEPAQAEADCFIRDQINETGEADLKCSGKISEDCDSCDKSDPEPPKLSYLKCPSYDFNKLPGRGCSGCVSDQTEHGCAYDRTRYLEEIKRQDEWLIHCEVLKEMCNSICKSKAYILEKNNYSMETIRGLSRGSVEFSFGFGDDGTGHSKYDASYRAEQYHVEEFHGNGRWIFEAGEVDQHVWNFNGREWHCKKEQAKTVTPDYDPPILVNDRPEIVDNYPETVNDVEKSVIETIEAGNALPCDTCGYDVQGCCDYDNEDMHCVCGDAWKPREQEQVETVEADIIQTVPEDKKPLFSEKYHVNELIKHEEETLAGMRESWQKNNPDVLRKHELMLLAYKGLLIDLEYPNPEQPEPVQPELPTLKNNDQRKEFIEAYETWPIWIDLKETGERYYRYDLTDKVAMVVKVSLRHVYESYKETKKIDFDSEQYYLLGIKSNYSTKSGSVFQEDASRTFYECSSNKSALVDYLKDFQKKGA